MVKVRVPATTANLGPGFDTLGMALGGLYNYVTLEESAKDLEITVEGDGKEQIPLDASNIVYKAIVEVAKRSGRKLPGISLHIRNEIPITRGLGTSAAATVAGLVAANELLGKPFNKDELLNIATDFEGHPDNVAPALLGKIVMSTTNVKGKVIYRQLEPPKDLYVVVAVPDFYVSTGAARRVLPDKISRKDAIQNVGHTGLLLWALMNNDFQLMGEMMDGDTFHQPYRKSLVPGMDDVFKAAKSRGAFGVALSGAGPSIIAFCRKEDTSKVGEAMVDAFAKNGVNCTYYKAMPNFTGTEIIDITGKQRTNVSTLKKAKNAEYLRDVSEEKEIALP
ncbi:MAG: homoserine kinase [Clostridia bacterium]|jgi:homoserine kinase|nr:homoserine kinase [Clostridia bacterium]